MARYIYQGVFKDGNGRVIEDGTVSVYEAGTSTPASIYVASAGGSAVNSVTSDSSGKFYFYVDIGDWASAQKFKITLSKTAYQTKSYDDIEIFPLLEIPTVTRHFEVPASAATKGATAPADTSIGLARGLGFDNNNEEIYFTLDIPGAWNESSDMVLRVNWAPDGVIGDTEIVKWDFEYITSISGDDLDAKSSTTATATYTQSGAGTQGEQIETDIILDYDDATNSLNSNNKTLHGKFIRDVTGEAGDTFAGQGVVFHLSVVYSSNTLVHGTTS
ncbi:hypothetical protein KAR91_56350 [Candidatus Pacearchaeota archaeon]|nr:hypothetical protein [Candidatus Pacearchaeota archaeon]